MPENNPNREPMENPPRTPSYAPGNSGSHRERSRQERAKLLRSGVRSISTPPGEPYNDVLLRRER